MWFGVIIRNRFLGWNRTENQFTKQVQVSLGLNAPPLPDPGVSEFFMIPFKALVSSL